MTSTDPMKNNGLLLGKNEVGMGWCLERLRAIAQSRPNARDLAIFKSSPAVLLIALRQARSEDTQRQETRRVG